MADEIDAKIIHSFATDIAGRLSEATVIARMADDFGRQGLTERAFQSLLEIEPLLHDTAALLQASTVVRRRDRDRRNDRD